MRGNLWEPSFYWSHSSSLMHCSFRKKCYIASYKKVRKLSVTDILPSHGAATLMANPTLALVVSRILVLDQAIDYKFKKKKRRGRPSFSSGNGSSTRSGGRKSKKMKIVKRGEI